MRGKGLKHMERSEQHCRGMDGLKQEVLNARKEMNA